MGLNSNCKDSANIIDPVVLHRLAKSCEECISEGLTTECIPNCLNKRFTEEQKKQIIFDNVSKMTVTQFCEFITGKKFQNAYVNEKMINKLLENPNIYVIMPKRLWR